MRARRRANEEAAILCVAKYRAARSLQNPCPYRAQSSMHRLYLRRTRPRPRSLAVTSVHGRATIAAMTLREKILFHQVHPAKLATDAVSAVVSLYFFWQHALIIGLLTHLVPPPVGSAIVMACVDLEPYKRSRLGAYLVRYMRPGAQAARLVGDLIMVVAAWFRAPGGIVVGLLIVLAAWSYGLASFRRD
jgi:hypothetical protein